MKTLVAGLGNVLLGDDGFGVEVAHRLRAAPLPARVRVEDFGVRGIHLVYELLEPYDAVILVDNLPDDSKLKQQIAGCVDAFGMCSNGTVVALNDAGKVVCPKAEVMDEGCLCEDDLSPCDLEATKTEVSSPVQLIKDFPVKNFLTREGTLPERAASKKKPDIEPRRVKTSKETTKEVPKEVSTEKYDDEDFGISPFLPKKIAEKRRAALRKSAEETELDPEEL